MTTTNVQVRVPTEIKKEADSLFESMGIDTGTAIRIFLTQSVGRRALPFAMAEPRDINGYTPAEAKRLLRAKRELDAGRGLVRDLVDD